MNYEVKKTMQSGVLQTRDGVYGIPVCVWTGIVGQTYEGFTNADQIFVPLLDTDTTITADAKVAAAAAAFSADKYPNT